MPQPDYKPKHRAPGRHKAPRSRPGIKGPLVMSSVAVAATGGVVGAGVVGSPVQLATMAGDAVRAPQGQGTTAAPASQSRHRAEGPAIATVDAAAPLSSEGRRRSAEVSRSDRRDATDPAKQAALSTAQGPAITVTEDLSDADPRTIAKALMPQYGYSVGAEFGCLDSLYISESNWRIDADNPTSSAYGIPQALTSMHDLPSDYYTSAEAQIRWGLDYIQRVYGTPCSAWSFKQGHNWY